MNKRIGLVVAGAAAAAVMVGGTAFAAVSSIPDSQGVIHGCYSANGATGTNGTPLNIVDTNQAGCSKGQTAVSWNQQGPAGPQGTQGPPGPVGPGATFTTASGPVLFLPQNGTYFIDVEADLNTGFTSQSGFCRASGPTGEETWFGGAFVLTESNDVNYSFSAIVTVTGAGSTFEPALGLTCADTAGNLVTPSSVQWWVMPVTISS